MEVNWNEIAGQVTTEVLRILIPVLAVLVLKWIAQIWKMLKEKHPELAELIAYAAQVGYAAAEEYFRNRKVSGEDKMAYAIERAYDYLATAGINNVDADVIRDCINQYGVANYKFSWSQTPIAALFKKPEEDPEEKEDPDGKDEDKEDHEPVNADDLCFGSDHDNYDADHNQAGEPAVRSGEGVEGEEIRERTPDDDQDGQAGGPDSADGQTPA